MPFKPGFRVCATVSFFLYLLPAKDQKLGTKLPGTLLATADSPLAETEFAQQHSWLKQIRNLQARKQAFKNIIQGT